MTLAGAEVTGRDREDAKKKIIYERCAGANNKGTRAVKAANLGFIEQKKKAKDTSSWNENRVVGESKEGRLTEIAALAEVTPQQLVLLDLEARLLRDQTTVRGEKKRKGGGAVQKKKEGSALRFLLS